MNKLIANAAPALVLILGLVVSPTAFAAEKTITLAVSNMDCADCPYIVKKSLERVPGVASVTVSYRDKTAIVTYDDAQTAIPNLIAATTNAGYPSAPRG